VIILRWILESLVGAVARRVLAQLRQAFSLWLVVRQARAEGAASQRTRDGEAAREAEREMAAIVAERRATAKTKSKLDEGSF
jgi:hypothetical protein